MHVWYRVLLAAVAAASLLPCAARADSAEDVARIHLEALGGRERIDALSSLRASGTIHAGGRQLQFVLVAARPNRIRLETEANGRTLVQASDGVEPPWEFDTGTWPPQYRDMAEAHVKTFTADAEFDDPLVGGEARGYRLEHGGEMQVDGRTLLRILVTHEVTGRFWLLLDPETYLIVLRAEQRQTSDGRPLQVVTRFDQYRPVDGVLLPHQVTMMVDGKVTQTMVIERIEAHPKRGPETFTRPKPAVRTNG